MPFGKRKRRYIMKYHSKGLKKAINNFRPWDFGYTVDVLIELLILQAKSLKRDTWHHNARHTYRKCMRCIYILKKYDDRPDWSTVLLFLRQPNSYHKNWSVVIQYDRKDKAEGWAYIGKHLSSFWS